MACGAGLRVYAVLSGLRFREPILCPRLARVFLCHLIGVGRSDRGKPSMPYPVR